MAIVCACWCAIPALASIARAWTSCSMPFTRRKATVWVSDSPSAAPSLRDITVVSGQNPMTDTVSRSRFPFLAGQRPSRPQHRNEALMMGKRSLVSVVDDDESVRESLPDLLRQLGFAAQAFSSAKAFLESEAISKTGCLILDV